MTEILKIVPHLIFWYGFPLVVAVLVLGGMVMGIRAVARRGRGSSDHEPIAIAGVCLGITMALIAGSVPLLNRSGPFDPEWLRALGLATIVMVPPSLALVGLRRPGALLVAGLVSVPMCLMSFSLLLFPLLIPAALYLIAYERAPVTTARLPAPAVALLTFVLLFLALLSLFMHDDPRCYEILSDGTVTRVSSSDRFDGSTTSVSISPGAGVIESGCASDTVTAVEAGASIALTGLAVALAVYLTGAPRSPAETLDVYA